MWAMSSDCKKRNSGSTLVKDNTDKVVFETEITNKPALNDPVRKRIESEDVHPMTELTADTPANPDEESDRIGSHTRETKYAPKKTEVLGQKTSGGIYCLEATLV